MVEAKEWTKKYTRDANIISLKNCTSTSDRAKIYVVVTIDLEKSNRNQTHRNNKERDPDKSYAEGLHTLEPWGIKKLKDKIIIDIRE